MLCDPRWTEFLKTDRFNPQACRYVELRCLGDETIEEETGALKAQAAVEWLNKGVR